MKQKHILILLPALCFLSLGAFTQGGTTGPLTWNISDNTLTISGNGIMPDYYSYAPWYPYRESIHTVVMENGVANIAFRAFCFCNNLTSVTIPNSVTSIGECAFEHCSSLTSVTIPNSVTSIGGVAFSNCSSLTSVIIPNSVTSIGSYAFSNCSSLTSITIPENVTIIETGAFAGCSSLQTVNFNATNCTIILVEWIPVFNNCTAFTTLNIGNNVNTIPDHVFYGSSIMELTIPNSVTSIGECAFEHCSSLTSLIIGNSVTTIGAFAFNLCSSITEITSYSTTPPTISNSTFYDVLVSIPVYVPCESYDSYMNASGWGNYFTNINDGGADKQQICMVSVDENNHNEIIWKKQDEVVVYKIYREGTQSGQYDLVATVDYNAPNIWVDTESNAKIRSYRYKISAINDVCDREPVLSDAHKTMHLTINAGQNNSWNLIWTAYEGTAYSTYNIYRTSGDTPGEFALIGTMPSGNTSFSDFSAPEGYVYYMVEIMLNETCNVGKSGSSIKSNIATNAPVGIVETLRATSLQVYPNPTTGKLSIVSDQFSVERIEIFDVYGRKHEGTNARKHERELLIDISHLSAGVYFVKIFTEAGEVVRKVVKE